MRDEKRGRVKAGRKNDMTDKRREKIQVLDMTKGAPAKLILAFAFPLMVGNVFQQLYTFIDTMIVGQKLGLTAIAAMGATEWLCFVMYGFIQGITQGCSVIISKKYGEKQMGQVQQAVFNAYVLAAVLAILFMGIGQVWLYPVLRLLHTPPEILEMAHGYLKILYAGIPITFAYNILAAVLRAFGNSRAPLMAMILASMGNIAFDLILVMVLEWGVEGAAYGTLAAQSLAALYCVCTIRKIREVRVEKVYRKPEIQGIKELLKLGIPMGLQNIITAAGGLVVQSVINGFGILFIAGYTAANKLYGLLEIAASSYGYAISTYTAQNMGAKEVKRMKKGLQAAILIGVMTGILMSAVMLVFGKPILGLFISEAEGMVEEAIRIGYQFLCILAVFFPLLYCLYIIRASIQGMGNSIFPMLSSLVQVFMRVVCAVGLTQVIGSSGVFWGEIMAWMGADFFLIMVLFRFYNKIIFLQKQGKLGGMEE